MIQFNPLNTNAKYYPKPSVPVLPIPGYSSITINSNAKTKSPFLQQGTFYNNARSALANALSLSNVDQNCAVLMPAYHCGSMIEPALWLKAEVLLYRLNKELTPDTQHIEQLINKSEKNVSVMLLPHYFGFLQDTSYWREFCDQHNITLIEDCAHAFFGHFNDNTAVGTKGHYAIASVRKFFCTPDGGILIGKNIKTNAFSLQKQSIRKQAHELLSLLQQSFYYKRLSIAGSLYSFISNLRPSHNTTSTKTPEISANIQIKHTQQQWKWFNPALVNLKGSVFSQWIIKHSDLEEIADKRKNNYLTLLNGVKNIQHLDPLFQTLPANTTPYMFPVLLTSGEKDFDNLKRAGMPIWRWEELAESDCNISQKYRLKLLHLPCHQELKPTEINWMLDTLEQTLGKQQ